MILEEEAERIGIDIDDQIAEMSPEQALRFVAILEDRLEACRDALNSRMISEGP